MPPKYSHVKKRSASGLLKREKNSPNGHHIVKQTHHARVLNPQVDRSITQAISAVSQLERAIARILLVRYEQDIARLFSTILYSIALVHLPTLVMRCITLGGPGWLAFNHDSYEIKDFFRAAICMDMRQAGEGVATKSVLWSYTALRHFVRFLSTFAQRPSLTEPTTLCQTVCRYGTNWDSTRFAFFHTIPPSNPISSLLKQCRLRHSRSRLTWGPWKKAREALERACEVKFGWMNDWEGDWRTKVRYGYEKLSQTLWRVAREFDVRGYGNILREKLTTKWCDCGCSTDHLGEVCERTVREDDEESGMRLLLQSPA